MAVARMALKNLQQKTSITCKNSVLLPCNNNIIKKYVGERLGGGEVHGWRYGLLQRLSSSTAAGKSDGKEVAVESDGGDGGRKRNMMRSRWRSLLPRPFRKPSSLWKRNHPIHHTNPFQTILSDSRLGNAIMEAAENMNSLFESVMMTTTPPSQLMMGKFKETDESYKLKYEIPGLSKEDLKVTIDNGVLRIRGERKVEEEDESDDDEDEEYYMMMRRRSYGYYNTSFALPEDVKQDDIKAEFKDGVLTITLPKTELSHAKDVKEVQVY